MTTRFNRYDVLTSRQKSFLIAIILTDGCPWLQWYRQNKEGEWQESFFFDS